MVPDLNNIAVNDKNIIITVMPSYNNASSAY